MLHNRLWQPYIHTFTVGKRGRGLFSGHGRVALILLRNFSSYEAVLGSIVVESVWDKGTSRVNVGILRAKWCRRTLFAMYSVHLHKVTGVGQLRPLCSSPCQSTLTCRTTLINYTRSINDSQCQVIVLVSRMLQQYRTQTSNQIVTLLLR